MNKAAAILVFLILCLAACGGTSESQTQPDNNSSAADSSNRSAAKTNVEELGMLAQIPYEVEDAAWKEDAGKKRLIAVLRLSPVDAADLSTAGAGSGAGDTVTLPVESWFPAELVAQADMSGDSLLRGRAHTAAKFYQEPYTAGRVTRVDGTDYFVLELSAK